MESKIWQVRLRQYEDQRKQDKLEDEQEQPALLHALPRLESEPTPDNGACQYVFVEMKQVVEIQFVAAHSSYLGHELVDQIRRLHKHAPFVRLFRG